MSATTRRSRSHRPPSNRSRNAGTAGQICIAAFRTELNWMSVAWRDDVLIANAFAHSSRRSAESLLARIPGLPQAFFRLNAVDEADDLPRWVTELIDNLQRFSEGEPVGFAKAPLALDHLTPFAQRVVAACRAIPWGSTRSYGEIAVQARAPGAARAVGSVMAKNRYPLIVPCHRVLAAGGAIGGYSAPSGLNMKHRLLAMESNR